MNVAWDGTKRAVLRWLCDTVPVSHQLYDVVYITCISLSECFSLLMEWVLDHFISKVLSSSNILYFKYLWNSTTEIFFQVSQNIYSLNNFEDYYIFKRLESGTARPSVQGYTIFKKAKTAIYCCIHFAILSTDNDASYIKCIN